MKNISIFLFVFTLCMIDNVYGDNLLKGQKTTLYFRNGLSYKKWLKVHCKSGNNDMGTHYLKPGGIDYQFSVYDNVFGGTLIWCTLSKGPDYKVSSTFDAYKQNNGKPHGIAYNYIAKDDGIYHSNLVEFKLHKKFNWK
ncbi:hypothetical protein N665_0076s0084 [Sinapis alba]|nr:hypothetical protein N665_0076s0084 [Sinapis alba]